MDIKHGKIRRRIQSETPSIPQETAVEIFRGLAYRCRFGRRNSQFTAAESLGLCWLCLTASRLRLPIYFNSVKDIKTTALQLDGEFPILLVPTFFGERPVRISCRIAKFLYRLSLIPSKKPRETILQSPSRGLTRTFDAVLNKISPNPEFGNITYVSFLKPPHINSYRFQPN